jgi:hypothetical protein
MKKSMQSLSRSASYLELLAALRRLTQAMGRAEAKIRFAMRRGRRLTPLLEEQMRGYRRAGYLLASGLIPAHLVKEAEAAMWRCLKAEATRRQTWPILGPHPHILKNSRLAAVYTQTLLAAAAQLSEMDVAGFAAPTHVYTINTLPVPGPWKSHTPHLDGSLPVKRLRTFPRPYWIASIIYLTDVRSRGGGTIVWPASHLKVEALARSDARAYRRLSALQGALANLDLGEPVEVTPTAGDVLFHHPFCVHASSDNLSAAPRLAMLHRW